MEKGAAGAAHLASRQAWQIASVSFFSTCNKNLKRFADSLSGRSQLSDTLSKAKAGLSRKDQSLLFQRCNKEIQWEKVLALHDWLCTNSHEAHNLKQAQHPERMGTEPEVLSELPGDEQRMLMLKSVMEQGGEHPAIRLFKTFQQCSRAFPNYWLENGRLELRTHQFFIGALGVQGNSPRAHYVYNDALSLLESRSSSEYLEVLTKLNNEMVKVRLSCSSNIRAAVAFLDSSVFTVCQRGYG